MSSISSLFDAKLKRSLTPLVFDSRGLQTVKLLLQQVKRIRYVVFNNGDKITPKSQAKQQLAQVSNVSTCFELSESVLKVRKYCKHVTNLLRFIYLCHKVNSLQEFISGKKHL